MDTQMQKQRIQYLIDRFSTGKCTNDETDELNTYLLTITDDELKDYLAKQWDFTLSDLKLDKKDSQKMFREIVHPQKTIPFYKLINNKRYRSMWPITAAVASVLLVLFLSYSHSVNHSAVNKTRSVCMVPPISAPDKSTNFTRDMVLPDGTRVLLRARSRLHIADSFNSKDRKVELTGEAYFDVKHDPDRPFVIKTGKVRTTVLGTAFCIKFNSTQQVEVAVTRGRVKVENKDKILAVLTPNEQLKYDQKTAEVKQLKIKASEFVTDWAKLELHFNKVSLQNVAKVLSHRFGKTIQIADLKLADTRIVSYFNGTESINEILDVICTITPHTHYLVKNNVYQIINE